VILEINEKLLVNQALFKKKSYPYIINHKIIILKLSTSIPIQLHGGQHFLFDNAIVDLIMGLAKLGNSVARLDHHLFGHGQNDSHKVGTIEAGAGQAEHALLLHQTLDKVELGGKFGEVDQRNSCGRICLGISFCAEVVLR
jgi:hypothetical protein